MGNAKSSEQIIEKEWDRMSQWRSIHEIEHERIKFAVILVKYKGQFIIIFNKKRNGWEIPGGNREAGESIIHTASRELFEETGARTFDLTPFGIYEWNGSFGMVFHAEVIEMTDLPQYEIDEIKMVDELPAGLNFGEMFYVFNSKWDDMNEEKLKTYSIDIEQLDKVNDFVIV